MSVSSNRDIRRDIQSASSGTEWITSADVLRWLGGSPGLLRSSSSLGGSSDAIAATRFQLAAGEALCTHATITGQACIIESGLVQCCSQQRELGLPATVRYSGAREWIGLHDPLGKKQEQVHAVVQTTLLAVSFSQVRALSAASPLVAELLARQTSMALKRDWRMRYSLRDLSPRGRIVEGLVHLLRLIDPSLERAPQDKVLRVALDVDMLGCWLGLPTADLRQQLDQLGQDGALCCDINLITGLLPHVLLRTSRSVVSQSMLGRPVQHPMCTEWDAAEPGCVWEDAS